MSEKTEITFMQTRLIRLASEASPACQLASVSAFSQHYRLN